MSIDPNLVAGGTYKIRLTAKKDGVVWDLTGATVTLRMRKPAGTVITRSMTLTDAPNGIADYTTLTTDLDAIGRWTLSFRVVQGAVDVPSIASGFIVTEAP